MPGATDNHVGNPGSGGENYASDSISSVHWPRVKMTWGVDGVAVDASATNPIPVTATGVSTEATLSAVNGKMAALGQGLMAASMPVVISSDHGAIPVAVLNTVPVTLTSTTVTGSVAVTGPLTDTQLRATSVPVSVVDPEASATFRGRVQTFRTPGRAGTAGQKIFALHNATGSTKIIHINQLSVDLAVTVVKAVTVLPPVVRVHRFTAVPTNGTALTKVAKDTSLSSNASVTAWGDASADGTGSATTLTVTIPAGSMLSQEFAARLITAAGYEPFDREFFLDKQGVVLRPLEGIVVFLDYVLATQNPVTDMWIVGCDWYEV